MTACLSATSKSVPPTVAVLHVRQRRKKNVSKNAKNLRIKIVNLSARNKAVRVSVGTRKSSLAS